MHHVLVTGATGFIGTRLVHHLIEEGYRVRALVRDIVKARVILPDGVELFRGDVTDRASIDRAMEGLDGVFHLAAIYAFGVDIERMRAVNVQGTRNLLAAAEQQGVNKIVYAGSDTSLGATEGVLCDESKVHQGDPRSAYEQTKREAHELVRARSDAGAPIVNAIVSTVYGPGDRSAISELIEHHLAGRLVVALDRACGYTFAHVDDVAEGLRLAYEQGAPGEQYLLSGTPMSFGDFFDELSRLTGIAAPVVELPNAAIPMLRPLLAALGPLIGKSADEMTELLSMGHGVTRYFDGAKARDELGWQPRTLVDGLMDTLPYYLERERAAAAAGLERVRPLLGCLALLDIVLGGTATLDPDSYLGWVHAAADEDGRRGGRALASRTGALWLVFAAIEALAAIHPTPERVLSVGVLRLLDVPADLVYRWRSSDLGAFGSLGLVVAPLFNVVSGTYLVLTAARALRARRVTPLELRVTRATDREGHRCSSDSREQRATYTSG